MGSSICVSALPALGLGLDDESPEREFDIDVEPVRVVVVPADEAAEISTSSRLDDPDVDVGRSRLA